MYLDRRILLTDKTSSRRIHNNFIASLPGSVQPEFHGLATNYHETLIVSRSCLNLSVIFK